ncbi:MAG: electron transport complex subunit RsxE [Lachnospiraceae bacterium]|nr:electron transport complex subunit RsxE [Lachnospiraceae bacterium]
MNKAGERLINGLVKENPTFVLMLGMCPTLAVTSSAINGLGMGLTTAVVLALSNMIISLMRKIIPSRVRIPAFIVIIASFVTIVQLLLEAYLPSLNEALGVYIPLIVVNCIILGRAEAYAYSNPPIASLFDGIGMGLGFSVALTAIGAVRELLGAGKIFGIDLGLPFEPIGIFVLAPGAFFVLAALTALQNYIKMRGEKKGKDMSKIQSGCNEDCMNCGVEGCSKRFYDAEAYEAEEMSPEYTEDISVAEENVVSETQEVVEENTASETVAEEKKSFKKKNSSKKAGAKKKAEAVAETAETVAETVETEVKTAQDVVNESANETTVDTVENTVENTVEDIVKDTVEDTAQISENADGTAKETGESVKAEKKSSSKKKTSKKKASAKVHDEKKDEKQETVKEAEADKTETEKEEEDKQKSVKADTLEVLDLDEEEDKA